MRSLLVLFSTRLTGLVYSLTFIACASTSGCQTGSQKITRDADIKFLLDPVNGIKLNVLMRSYSQTTSTKLQLHQENTEHIGRLKSHDALLSQWWRHICCISEVLDLDQRESLCDMGKSEWRIGEYEEFFLS